MAIPMANPQRNDWVTKVCCSASAQISRLWPPKNVAPWTLPWRRKVTPPLRRALEEPCSSWMEDKGVGSHHVALNVFKKRCRRVKRGGFFERKWHVGVADKFGIHQPYDSWVDLFASRWCEISRCTASVFDPTKKRWTTTNNTKKHPPWRIHGEERYIYLHNDHRV